MTATLPLEWTNKRKRDYSTEPPVNPLLEYAALLTQNTAQFYSQAMANIDEALRQVIFECEVEKELCDVLPPNKVRRDTYFMEMAQREAPADTNKEDAALSLQLLGMTVDAPAEPDPELTEPVVCSSGVSLKEPTNNEVAEESECGPTEQKESESNSTEDQGECGTATEPDPEETTDEEESECSSSVEQAKEADSKSEKEASPVSVPTKVVTQAKVDFDCRSDEDTDEYSEDERPKRKRMDKGYDPELFRIVHSLNRFSGRSQQFTKLFADEVQRLVTSNRWDLLDGVMWELGKKPFANFALMWKELHARSFVVTQPQAERLLDLFALNSCWNSHRQCGRLLLTAARYGAMDAVKKMVMVSRLQYCKDALEEAKLQGHQRVAEYIEREIGGKRKRKRSDDEPEQVEEPQQEQAEEPKSPEVWEPQKGEELKPLSPLKEDPKTSRTLTTARRNVRLSDVSALPVGSRIVQSYLATFDGKAADSAAWCKLFVDNVLKLVQQSTPTVLSAFVESLGDKAVCSFPCTWNELCRRGLNLTPQQIENLLSAFTAVAKPANRETCAALLAVACTYGCIDVVRTLQPHVSCEVLKKALNTAKLHKQQTVIDFLSPLVL